MTYNVFGGTLNLLNQPIRGNSTGSASRQRLNIVYDYILTRTTMILTVCIAPPVHHNTITSTNAERMNVMNALLSASDCWDAVEQCLSSMQNRRAISLGLRLAHGLNYLNYMYGHGFEG